MMEDHLNHRFRGFHFTFALRLSPLFFLLIPLLNWAQGQAIVVDHTCTRIAQIPESAIVAAKQSLHIAYGHTSHGSQLITGMNELVAFMNGKGYPTNLYAWNETGANGALRLDDYAFSGASDLGNPDFIAWEGATRTYLSSHPLTNVVIWSWCGQVSGASEANINTYLSLMDQLETDFPGVKFVYMTGHLDGSGSSGNLTIRNNQIRAYCRAHQKILYDFADIESYDPDGLTPYMPLLANDNCDYDSDGNGSRDRNWAIAWQNSHILNVDWYSCSPAHSQALNGNLKAYAAWWLWARLAGWSGDSEAISLDLTAGWNWVSLPLQPGDVALSAVFSGIISQVEVVKTQTQSVIRSNNAWVGDLADMGGIIQGKMYKVRVTGACTMTVSGTRIASSTAIALAGGWNWGAYLPGTTQDINTALQSIMPQILQVKSQTQSAVSNGNGGLVGDLLTMTPGQGYTIRLSVPAVLVYGP